MEYNMNLSQQIKSIPQHSQINYYSAFPIKEGDKQLIASNFKRLLVRAIENGYNRFDARQIINTLDLNKSFESLEDEMINKLFAEKFTITRQSILSSSVIQLISRIQPSNRNNSQFNSHQDNNTESNLQKCEICFNTLTNFTYIEQCNHIFCNQCLFEYLREKIMSGNVLKIVCPSQECPTIFSDEFIKDVLDNKDLYQKFRKFQSMKLAMNNPNIKCCPRTDCDKYVNISSNDKLFCECGQQICVKCFGLFHENISCDDQVEKVFQNAVQEFIIQKCPQCSSLIQKDTGCNHMICTQCGYEFCWLCRKQYTLDHYNRLNFLFGCPGQQYTDATPYQYPILMRIFNLIIGLIILPFIIVFWICMFILSGFYAPYYLIQNTMLSSCWDSLEEECYTCLCSYLILVIITIILYPLTLIGVLIYIFIKLFDY